MKPGLRTIISEDVKGNHVDGAKRVRTVENHGARKVESQLVLL